MNKCNQQIGCSRCRACVNTNAAIINDLKRKLSKIEDIIERLNREVEAGLRTREEVALLLKDYNLQIKEIESRLNLLSKDCSLNKKHIQISIVEPFHVSSKSTGSNYGSGVRKFNVGINAKT